ncbi:MAG: DUF421 domain-containing protein [Bacteroidota bacterium]|nr:DUF421 domain-containing protein [Bacteroidota bacterium]
MDYLETSLGSIAIYILIIICFRLLGKKGLSDLSIADLVLVIIIGEALGSIIPTEEKFKHAIICIISLSIINYLLEFLTYKYKGFRKIVEGIPVILVNNGNIISKNLKKEKLTKEDLMEAVRTNGMNDLAEVKLAVLETDGNISIISKK